MAVLGVRSAPRRYCQPAKGILSGISRARPWMVVHRRDPAIYDTPTEACSLRAPLGRMMTPASATHRIAVAAAIIGLAISLQPHTVPLIGMGLPASAAPALAQAARTVDPTARRDFVNLPGVRLWFTDTGGSGEPVVLMHANTGTSEVWEAQVAALSKAGYRVIAFDRRGWGRSEANPATGAQPGHASEDLHALADYLLLSRFHLVGVAGGGFVALDYAAWHPDRLSSLVVGASTGSVSERGDSGLRSTDRNSRHPIAARALPRSERVVSRRQPRRHEALARDRTARAPAERASTATAIVQHVREARWHHDKDARHCRRRRSPRSTRPHATLGSPRQGRPVGNGAGRGPLDCLGAARCLQRHRPAILARRAAVSERSVTARCDLRSGRSR